MFVDRVQIEVSGGRGGDGCLSFRREKYVPRGGPDGGDGGNGGSVIIIAEEGVDSLSSLAHRKHWRADRGTHGQGNNRHGKNADDVTIRVPPGTLIIDANRKFAIKDLAAAGDQVVAAHGGRGGKGNTHFKSSTNRAPRQFTHGGDAESRKLILELKVIADVGLIGKPNAGKSTLLARLSRARPEIADYPFTTKFPNLGRVEVSMDRWFVMADIPGLIEGAHAGVGLGHEFLRHVERTRLLVHLVEPQPTDGTDPIENYLAIRDELKQYKIDLTSRQEIVAVTKSELPEAQEIHARLADELQRPVLAISAVTGQNLDRLQHSILEHLDTIAATE
jgi:GTP-binding protein